MTTCKRSRCRWTVLATSLAAILAAPHAVADMRTAALATGSVGGGMLELVDAGSESLPDGATQLFLEVVINQAPTGQLARIGLVDGRLVADPETLRALGLAWPGSDGDAAAAAVVLEEIPGVAVSYDASLQRLHLMVPVALLSGPAATFGYAPPPAPPLAPETRAPGLLLNYDVFAQGDRHSRSLSNWYELRLFGTGPGVWRSSGVLRSSDRPETSSSAVRLDTSWQLDFPERMVSVRIGDGIGGLLDWTRSTRFGGIRVSRDFSLQPYRVTVPLASFAGEAALPSTVDLFVDGIRQAQQQVGPGQFRIDGTPILSGAGQAQLVVTDINGQSRTLSFSLYNARQLLQGGLSDWSFEAGKLRREYGRESFAYAEDAMASGSFRHGAGDRLTLEAHAETTRGLDMAGAGAVWLVGRRGGVASASYASSRSGAGRGTQQTFGYQWQGRRFNVDASTLRRDRAFRDVASMEGSLLPARTDLVFAGVGLGRGHLAASYVRQDTFDQPSSRYAGLTWSQSFGRGLSGAHVSLSFNHDLERGSGTSGNLYLSIPLGRQHQAWASASRQERGSTASVGASRSAGMDQEDWGWRVQASSGDQAGGQAELSRLARHGQWRVGAQRWNAGNTLAYANASGGVLLMQGRLFPMRQAYDAFAVVSTDGIPDVPVKLENRLVGTTDEHGLLLVTPLNAWQKNDLSIDPLLLPPDISVGRTRLSAVPATASGMLARFPMHAVVAVQFAVRDARGQWLAPGTQLRAEDGSPVATVGHDGLVYLENPPAGGRLRAPTAACSVSLPATLPARGWIDLGELQCH